MTYTQIIPVHEGDDGGGGNNMSHQQAMSLKQQLVHGWFQCTTRETMSKSNLYMDGSSAQQQRQCQRATCTQMVLVHNFKLKGEDRTPAVQLRPVGTATESIFRNVHT